MHHFTVILRRIAAAIHRENLHRVALIIVLVIFFGSGAFFYFEEKVSFGDALWWSVVTMTTVGYGDISPQTTGGRIVGFSVMLMGIGFLGLLTATIASAFIEKRLLENKGMKPTKVTDHFIICGWNFRGNEIVTELRADAKSANTPIVIIADIAEKPVDDPQIHFVRGEVNTDSLERANTGKAQGVIILSDDQLDSYARDAKTILNTLTIKSLYPTLYACVELMESKNAEHCRMAKSV
ncbi:MAG: ion channel [Desulfobacterales bacterium]